MSSLTGGNLMGASARGQYCCIRQSWTLRRARRSNSGVFFGPGVMLVIAKCLRRLDISCRYRVVRSTFTRPTKSRRIFPICHRGGPTSLARGQEAAPQVSLRSLHAWHPQSARRLSQHRRECQPSPLWHNVEKPLALSSSFIRRITNPRRGSGRRGRASEPRLV